MTGKIIIISAPSGCGKSTIINALLHEGDIDMQFSVSATNRSPRPGEVDGKDYYFLSTEDFSKAINEGAFLEFEQVYPGRYYGTLKREIERICHEGHNAILDIDVKGASHVKGIYGNNAINLFIAPPSLEALKTRLEKRGTESAKQIQERISRAAEEIELGQEADVIVVNDDLEMAIIKVDRAIKDFLEREQRG